jgi:hypothetical protein
MLYQMLNLILAGQVGTQRQLAELLQVSETLVAEMIDQLVGLGYLEEAVMCVDQCHGCSLQAGCGDDRHVRLWSVTDKGRHAALG